MLDARIVRDEIRPLLFRPPRVVVAVEQRGGAQRCDRAGVRHAFERDRNVHLARVERGIEVDRHRVAERDVRGEWLHDGQTVCSTRPRVARMRATVSPILLFGVLAPAVTPMRTGPEAGSHSVSVASTCCDAGAAIVHGAGLWIQPGCILDVVRRHPLGAQRRERDRVARVESADHDHRREWLARAAPSPRPAVPASRCRSCRRCGSPSRARRRRAPARSPAPPLRRSRATPWRASSSGWRRRRGAGARRDRSRATPPCRTSPGRHRGRRGPRCSRTRSALRPCRAPRDSCPPGYFITCDAVARVSSW